jgi:hypothetical protein
MSYLGMEGMKGRRLSGFPNPFSTYSRTLFPRTVREVFDWADFVWTHFGTYTQAIRRSVRYFLTDIEVTGDREHEISYDTRKKYERYLRDGYRITNFLGSVGDDLIGFGNSFTSVYVPIRRDLGCPKCGTTVNMDKVKYRFENFEFKGVCLACKREVVFERVDIPERTENMPVRVIRWNPRDIMIDHCPVTDTSRYLLRIPSEWVEAITKGDPMFLKSVPWEMVDCVKSGQLFELESSMCKHLKINVAATMQTDMQGWGLPLFMNAFEEVVYLQILRRFNEAIALDYLVPFRLISPPAPSSGADVLRTANMGVFTGAVRRMIQEHRYNPTTWHTVPFPVQYQALGGEARQMVPVELMDRALDDLLTTMGIPQDFYRSSLASGVQSTPIGLRMFEKEWAQNVSCLNEWLDWFTDICANTQMWERVNAKLVKTSIHEDDNIRSLKLDLAAAGQVSRHTAYRGFGIDVDYERERKLDEEIQDVLANQRMSEKMEALEILSGQLKTQLPMTSETMAAQQQQQQQQQQGGGGAPPAPGGGAPPAPGGGGGMMSGQDIRTIDDLMEQADAIAQQIIVMEPSQRRSELINLKKSNEALHAQVKQRIDTMENQAATAGKNMARQGQM